jgi:hypothetical protein
MPDITRCGACPNPAAVQWRRRSADEPNHTDAAYACGLHAIHLDAASQVHQATCSAPSVVLAPACDCTPEPLPPPEPLSPADPTVTLPTGWVVPGPPTVPDAPASAPGVDL